MSRTHTTWIFAALVGVYFAAHVGVQLPHVLDTYVSQGGMVNWFGAVRDAGADQADGELQAFKRQTGLRGSSPGFNVVRGAMRLVGDPVRLGKALAWVLVAVTLVFLFRLGLRLAGPAAALLACVLFLHMPGLPQTLSGIPHTYAWPILAAFLWFQEVERPRAAVVCVVLAGLFYPPLALLCGVLFLVRRTRRTPDGLRLPWRDREVWVLAGASLLVLALIFPWSLLVGQGDRVSWLSYEGRFARDAAIEQGDGLPPADMPADEVELPFGSVLEIAARELADAVAQPLMVWGDAWLPLPQVWWFRHAPALLALALLALAVLGGRKLARPPRVIAELWLVSLGTYLLAVLFALYLFVPDRYLLYTLPVASCLYVAVLAARGIERLPAVVRTVAPPLLAVVYLAGWGSGTSRHSEWVQDFGEAEELLAWLRTTPEDTVVAGPLVLMDAVELFADRETLVFCQEVLSTTDALDGPMYDDLRQRVAALHEAYYADDARLALAFMQRHGVDLLVLQERTFVAVWLDDVQGACELPRVQAEPLVEGEVELALPRLDGGAMEYADDAGFRVLSREGLAAHLAGR